MIRWLIVMVLAMCLMSGLVTWLRRWGLGRLPGDLHFRCCGREVELPLGSAVLLSLLAAMLQRLL